ncbi:MAG: DeoR/GlpR transcriptional regulator [Clostridia bacterium]|nr:DeoR/GlpR transcriptional regulator [Clostridia bacterium]
MVIEGRKKEILELLYQNGKVLVTELSKTLFVSEMTIRRDLEEMEKSGFIRRFRGGALLRISAGEMPLCQRLLMGKDEKAELCARCERFLHDGMTVFIDSSSTCQYLIPHIRKFRHMTVVTNSVKALQTAGGLHIPCILIGGHYYEQDMCLIGSITEQYARELNVDIAFFSTAAYSSDGVISDFDIPQTTIRKIMMQNAKETVFLFESHKLNKKLLYTLCRKEDVTAVIVTEPVPEA